MLWKIKLTKQTKWTLLLKFKFQEEDKKLTLPSGKKYKPDKVIDILKGMAGKLWALWLIV